MIEPIDTPQAVVTALQALETDLAERQNEYEQVTQHFAQLKREWELKRAMTYLTTEGTVAEREARTLTSVVAADAEFYAQLKEAESRTLALKSAIGVIEHRASLLQSVLRAQTLAVTG